MCSSSNICNSRCELMYSTQYFLITSIDNGSLDWLCLVKCYINAKESSIFLPRLPSFSCYAVFFIF